MTGGSVCDKKNGIRAKRIEVVEIGVGKYCIVARLGGAGGVVCILCSGISGGALGKPIAGGALCWMSLGEVWGG